MDTNIDDIAGDDVMKLSKEHKKMFEKVFKSIIKNKEEEKKGDEKDVFLKSASLRDKIIHFPSWIKILASAFTNEASCHYDSVMGKWLWDRRDARAKKRIDILVLASTKRTLTDEEKQEFLIREIEMKMAMIAKTFASSRNMIKEEAKVKRIPATYWLNRAVKNVCTNVAVAERIAGKILYQNIHDLQDCSICMRRDTCDVVQSTGSGIRDCKNLVSTTTG